MPEPTEIREPPIDILEANAVEEYSLEIRFVRSVAEWHDPPRDLLIGLDVLRDFCQVGIIRCLLHRCPEQLREAVSTPCIFKEGLDVVKIRRPCIASEIDADVGIGYDKPQLRRFCSKCGHQSFTEAMQILAAELHGSPFVQGEACTAQRRCLLVRAALFAPIISRRRNEPVRINGAVARRKQGSGAGASGQPRGDCTRARPKG